MKIVKTILAAVCICTGIFSSDMVYAGSKNASPEDSDTAAQEELLDPENPAFQEKKKEEEVKIPGLTKQQAASYMSPYTGKVYIHAESKKNHRAVYGIDVSKWQGEINWEKVKKAGIEFVEVCSSMCLHHHERFDGKGYPHGITGKNNSIFNQMCKLVDEFVKKRGMFYGSDVKPIKYIMRRLINDDAGMVSKEVYSVFDDCEPMVVSYFLKKDIG